MHQALLLYGVSGVGKSTMAQAVGGYLTGLGRATAVVDTDALAQFGPGPTEERSAFYNDLKCTNLASVWANYRTIGLDFVVVAAAGIRTRQLRDQYAASLEGCAVQVAQLLAPPDLIRERLRRRHDAISSHPDTHRRDTVHLEVTVPEIAEDAARLDALQIADFSVMNDRSARDVAAELVERAGWL